MNATNLREDVLVSICFSDLVESKENLELLRIVADQIAKRYRFWEILLVVSAGDASNFAPLLSWAGNIRVLKVRRHADFYRRRTVAANEAIGDIVVLASPEEMPYVNLTEMIDAAADSGDMVVARHAGSRPRNLILEPVLRILGRSAGFRVSAQDMQTIAIPRPVLNQLLVRSDRQLALRFPPYDEGIPVRHAQSLMNKSDQRTFSDFARRLRLLQWLLVSSAPRILLYVSILSLSVTLIGILYAVYALTAWLLLDRLAEGWLTLSLMLSMTAVVNGAALLGVSLGLQQVLELLSRETLDDVVSEDGSTEVFSKVARDLNVAIDIGMSSEPLTPSAPETAVLEPSEKVRQR
jgi:acetolactate synthase regulatory subunit